MRDDKTALGFTDEWLRLGVVTANQLETLAREYHRSDDKNPEHYRYRAFSEYLAANSVLCESQLEALYELGIRDPAPGLSAALLVDVVNRPECPETLRERALASGHKSLATLVTRRRMLDLLAAGVTDELFERVLAAGDAVTQRALVERYRLSDPQLQRLAESGASRAVRNLAAQRRQRGSPLASSLR